MLRPASAKFAFPSASIADATQRLLAVAAALTAAALLAAAPHAQAADTPAGAAPHEVRGVKLDSICSVCGVVSDVHTETRNAPADGKGVVAGAVVGGLAGHGMGGGSGRTAMTVLGAIGGGLAGNEVEKRARAETVYDVRVRMDDGSVRTIQQKTAPATGSRVTVEGNTLRVTSSGSGNA